MTSFSRLLSACLALTVAFAPPLQAYSLLQMKEMEAKVKNLVSKNMPAVVSLFGEKTSAAGSGVIVSSDGLILTAAHVTRGNEEMIVIFPDGKQTKCKVLGSNYDRDLGLAKITVPGTYPYCVVGDSDKLEVTSIVIGLGHPGGHDIRRTPPVRIGRVSMKNMGGFLVSDCTLISGDSGGPLFDLEGKVVGIHSSISESLSFNRDAPVNAAKADWDKLLEGRRWGKLPGPPMPPPQRKTAAPVLGAVFDPQGRAGCVLKKVQWKSPLDTAGLKAGDIILKFGGEDTKSSEAVAAKLEKSKPGDKLDLVYSRNGVEAKTQITLISSAEMLKRMEAADAEDTPADAPPKKDTPPAPGK